MNRNTAGVGTSAGMVAPAAGGGVLAQWDDILAAAALELSGHARAVAIDVTGPSTSKDSLGGMVGNCGKGPLERLAGQAGLCPAGAS
ncbi:hypothetical protein [Streptomyces violaceusniger]